MGAMKKMQMEEAEAEYNRKLRDTQAGLDALGIDEDAEDWLAFNEACGKDD